MKYLIIIIITFGIVALAFFLSRKKSDHSNNFDTTSKVGYGIKIPEEELELERHAKEEIMKLLETMIVSSGYFRKEKIPELMATLRKGSVPFGSDSVWVLKYDLVWNPIIGIRDSICAFP